MLSLVVEGLTGTMERIDNEHCQNYLKLVVDACS